MFCHQCGTQIENGMVFCSNCGAKQVAASTQQPNNQENDVADNQGGNTAYYQPVNQTQFVQNYPDANAAGVNGEPSGFVSFGEAIKLFFVNIINFKGRSNKSEFWWAFLFYAMVATCVGWIPIVGILIVLGFMLPCISLEIRRLNDIGRPWSYIFMGLIPFAGAIILLVQFLKDSDTYKQ